MLFSHPDVASEMSERFECAWETVRKVPKVTIDFGDGAVVRRTLHGNVVTWVCDDEGRVLDAVPGVVTTAVYRERLAQAALLAKWVAAAGEGTARAARLLEYHRLQAARLGAEETPARLVERERPANPLAKFRIERGVEVVLDLPMAAMAPAAPASAPVPQAKAPPDERALAAKHFIELPTERAVATGAPSGRAASPAPTPRPRADDSLLAEDARHNETVRRRAVHELLAAAGPVPYGDLTKRVYRDVLRCDLDDPWLGLGALLFDAYPFER